MTPLTSPITDKMLHCLVDTRPISSLTLLFDILDKFVQLRVGDIIELQSVV